MKDTLSVTKKRVLKEVELTFVEGVWKYQDADMTEALPLSEAFTPFLGETATITIVNKDESDDIVGDPIDVEDE